MQVREEAGLTDEPMPCPCKPPKCPHTPRPLLTNPRIETSIRIRRAIHLNDLVLLKRIIKNNPRSLQNPDFTDNGNTSLHLAAQLGFFEIAVRKLPNPVVELILQNQD